MVSLFIRIYRVGLLQAFVCVPVLIGLGYSYADDAANTSRATGAIDQMPTEQRELYWFVRDAILEQVNAIQQGVCRIDLTISELKGDKLWSESARLFYAFDAVEDLFRFDRNPHVRVHPDGSLAALSEGKTLRYVSTRDSRLLWNPDASVLVICHVDQEPPSFDRKLRPFDIRSVSLLTPRDYVTASANVDVLLDRFWSEVGAFNSISVSESDIDVQVSWKKDVLTRTVYVDKRGGYLVSKMIFISHLPQEYGGTTTIYENHVQWEQRNDTWVPTTVSASSGGVYLSRGDRQTVEMQITWESVNEPVPESLFTEAALNVPDLTPVVDMSSPTPVVIRRTGEEDLIAEARQLIAASPQEPRAGRVIWLILINVVLALAICSVAIYRRVVKRR